MIGVMQIWELYQSCLLPKGFEQDQRRPAVIAHYLVFIGIAVDSIFIWIGYFIARWVIKTQLANDMTILFKAPGHCRLTGAIGSGITLVRIGSNMKPHTYSGTSNHIF